MTVRTQLYLSPSTIAVCTRTAYFEDSVKIAFISSVFRVKRGSSSSHFRPNIFSAFRKKKLKSGDWRNQGIIFMGRFDYFNLH